LQRHPRLLPHHAFHKLASRTRRTACLLTHPPTHPPARPRTLRRAHPAVQESMSGAPDAEAYDAMLIDSYKQMQQRMRASQAK